MTNTVTNLRKNPLAVRQPLLVIAAAIAMLGALPSVQAQTAAPADNAMVRLIRGLIQSGALTKDVGEALLAQAQTEALAAQQTQRLAAAAPANGGGARVEPGDVRVPYISATVRDQIRDDLKSEVMAQAKAEGWAAPNETPEWTKRIRIEGDMRVRNELRFYSSGNSNEITDWNQLNASGPYDINKNTNKDNPYLLNRTKDRTNQLRIRARLGILADISENTTAGIRLATGSDNNPVSTTQTLGGGLSKKNIWLDQAWVSYKFADWVTVTGGRFANPFVSTDMLFSNDLNLDGLAAQFTKTLSNTDVTVFGTLGLVPLEYSADNAPSRDQDKMNSQNKWLIGAQVGASWKLNAENKVRGALGYYDFKNIEGQVSNSCFFFATSCSTDWSRPAFVQGGNTMMLLRKLTVNPADPANTVQPQYVGLASKFQLLDVNLRWDTRVAGHYGLRLDANYIRNLAFDQNEMIKRSQGGIVNNFRGTDGTTAEFQSGGNAYMLQATLGNPNPSVRGDWNVLLGYKRIDPDALPDAYNDSTFHQGGTNARGYYLGGTYAVDKNTSLGGRWSATKAVFGPPTAIDTLQLELNTRF